MKKLTNLFLIIVLALTLSSTALAGGIEMPGVTSDGGIEMPGLTGPQESPGLTFTLLLLMVDGNSWQI